MSQLKYNRLLKRIAKKTDLSTKQVVSVWTSVEEKMVEEGITQEDPLFVQKVGAEVKKQLGVEDNVLSLDRFKKFL